MDHEQLYRRAREGDEQAFAALLAAHEPLLRARIRVWIDRAEDSDDVYQQILLAAWKDLSQLREPEHFRYWLMTLARRRCQSFLRQRRAPEHQIDPKTMEEWETLTAEAQRRSMELSENVREALQRLPTVHRALAEQFYIEGLSIAQIAAATAIPQGTIKRRLMEARQHIAGELEITGRHERIKIMTTPQNLDAVLQTVRDQLTREGRARFAALLDRADVIAGIQASIQDYETTLCSPGGQNYFQTVVKPLLREVTDFARWPAELSMDYFCELKRPDGVKFNGFSLGIEIETPGAAFKGFSLGVIDLWYGRWYTD